MCTVSAGSVHNLSAHFRYSHICVSHIHTCTYIDKYTCTYIYLFKHTHIYLCIFTYLHMYMYICMYMCLARYMCVCVYSYLCVYIHTYIPTHVFVCVCFNIHLHIKKKNGKLTTQVTCSPFLLSLVLFSNSFFFFLGIMISIP